MGGRQDRIHRHIATHPVDVRAHLKTPETLGNFDV